MRHLNKTWACTMWVGFFMGSGIAMAQRKDINEDETAVRPYVLPELLIMTNGTRVGTADEWRKIGFGVRKTVLAWEGKVLANSEPPSA